MVKEEDTEQKEEMDEKTYVTGGGRIMSGERNEPRKFEKARRLATASFFLLRRGIRENNNSQQTRENPLPKPKRSHRELHAKNSELGTLG